MEDIKFRKNRLYQLFINGKSLGVEGASDLYSEAFLNAITFTEVCYNCQYAQRKRVSDSTLGDSWGSELSLEDQKKGVSLILVQTEKGKELLGIAALNFFDVNSKKAINNNHQLYEASKRHKNYFKFFVLIQKIKNFDFVFLILLLKIYMKRLIKSFLILLRIVKTNF